ncbi:MAG: HPr family phosphocarrier protein [Porticoccaceae bacterium]
MIQKELKIINKLGLHARAAAKLASTANHFACRIHTGICTDANTDTKPSKNSGKADKLVDAKSVMALMLLAASQGTVLNFEFDGEDEQQADEGVSALIAARFDEAE